MITGLKYDSGNYEGALNKALAHIGYDALRAEQKAAREKGRYLGIGVSTYVEICGLGPIAGCRRRWIPGRAVGKRDRSISSVG